MKASSKFVRTLVSGMLLIAAASVAGAASFISETSSFFTPSYRGGSNSTYFGWRADTIGISGTTINGTPSINPAALSGTSFLTQAGSNDIVSSTNNIYSSVNGVNNAQLSLHIPTSGTVGSAGFTTIIVQTAGFGGFGFALDTFGFGAIAGVTPTFEYGINAAGAGQGWVKWEIPGNEAVYDVAITGYNAGAGVLSVTDLVVDTWYSPTSFATDSVAAVPEPSIALLGVAGLGVFALRRRRNA